MKAWLGHAEATRRIMREKYHHLADVQLLTATVEENVLIQHLRTHPSVAAGLARGKLKLHGSVDKMETGEVMNRIVAGSFPANKQCDSRLRIRLRRPG